MSSEDAETSTQGLLRKARLIKQGAEARVYKLERLHGDVTTTWPSTSDSQLTNKLEGTRLNSPTDPAILLKHRFPKRYRHPALDTTLTRSRVQAEARSLFRCLKAGIIVPKLKMVDAEDGLLGLEWIDGWSVREVLGGGAEGEDGEADDLTEEQLARRAEAESALDRIGVSKDEVMSAIGSALATMHVNNIIHGDLTTSNMMLRPLQDRPERFEIVLIDFGLSSFSTLQEAMAVDLYVLERAFASTHPASESHFQRILDSYATGMGEKRWTPVMKRLEDVRLRGRKRDMSG